MVDVCEVEFEDEDEYDLMADLREQRADCRRRINRYGEKKEFPIDDDPEPYAPSISDDDDEDNKNAPRSATTRMP
jgi:hypothetical protein